MTAPRMAPMQLGVEIAATPTQRERGLMDRWAKSGMLFLFNHPTRDAFWNERTHLPLDIFFIGHEGHIVTRHVMQTIEESVVPVEYAPVAPYVAVLELPRGLVPPEAQRVSLGPIDYRRGIGIVVLEGGGS